MVLPAGAARVGGAAAKGGAQSSQARLKLKGRRAIKSAMSIANASARTRVARLSALVRRVHALPGPRARAVAAMVGACVADAAARPFHWLYDTDKLAATVAANSERRLRPEFWPESCSPFYSLPTGRNSCYNDLALVSLRALLSSHTSTDGAHFDAARHREQMLSMFGECTEYAAAFARRQTAYDPVRRLEERQPVDGPWQQGAVASFLARTNNAASRESDGFVTALPLIAQLGAAFSLTDANADADRAFQHAVAEAAAALNSNRFALRHVLTAALILRRLISHGHATALSPLLLADQEALLSCSRAVDETAIERFGGDSGEDDGAADVVASELHSVFEAVAAARASGALDSHAHTAQVAAWGRQCAYPGSFMGALLASCSAAAPFAAPADSAPAVVEQDSAFAAGFADAIRLVIRAGGCNCSRANLAGALLGAAFGLQEAPVAYDCLGDRAEAVSGDAASAIHGSAGSVAGPSPHTRGVPFEWLCLTDNAEEVLELALARC